MKQLDHSSQRYGAKWLEEREATPGILLPRNSARYLSKGEAALGAGCLLRIISQPMFNFA